MRKTLSVLAAALLVAAACSDSDESGFGPTSTEQDGSATTTTAPGGDGGEGDDGRRGDEFAGPDCLPPSVLVSTGGRAQAPTEECDPGPATPQPEPEPEPVPEPELGTGDVQVTLRWDSSADIDLHVVEPDGTRIYYGDKGPTSTGGRLDVDSNVGCAREASVENVFWPEGEIPEGTYTVEVNGYSVDGCGGGDYELVANVRGEEVLNETGTVGEDETDSYEFSAS